jgi:hypothetical protein
MYFFDIETLGISSESVILSAAILYVDVNKPNHTIESLRDDTLFVKFKVKEQVEQYKRTTDKSTIAWWTTQCDNIKKLSYYPSKEDVSVTQGITYLRNFIKSFNVYPEKDLIWTRGNLDSVVMDSLCRASNESLLMPYWAYRCTRTFICTQATISNKGYCDIDLKQYPTFDRNKLTKHSPIDDIILDALMVLYSE